MLNLIGDFKTDFLKSIENSSLKIISSNRSSGIISSAILIKTLKRLDKTFSLTTIHPQDKISIHKLTKNSKSPLLLIDLNIEDLKEISTKTFLISNQQISKEDLNENLTILNPSLSEKPLENLSNSSGFSYLLAKEISNQNIDLSKIALIGLIEEKSDIINSDINQEIISDSGSLKIKKGLRLYPSTRPLKRALEWSVSPYIPEVTGNAQGVLNLLKESNINPEKNLIDLDSNEMSNLITSIMLKKKKTDNEDEIIGNIYSLKLFDGIEDLREISVLLKTCSKLGHTDTAISYCLEISSAKSKAQDIYTKYKQELITALKTAEGLEKINGKGFVILNAKDKIKDTIFRTVLGMISSSEKYSSGTILIGMTYNQDKVQIQTKMIGKEGRSLKELLEKTVINLNPKNIENKVHVGGHNLEAACIVERDSEENFIEALKKNLEIEVVKV